MIVFACQQCGKRFARPESTSGSALFCECGTRNQVPWESTLPDSEAPPPPPPLPEPRRPDLDPWLAGRPLPRQRNPAYCFNHQDTPPQHTCPDCGERFCADCVLDVQGQALCGPCKNLRMRNRQRPPQVSVAAILAPIIALITGPGAVFVMFFALGMAQTSGSISGAAGGVVVIALFALTLQALALLLAAWSLRNLETNPRLSGRALAITGMVAALVSGVLIADVAIMVLHLVN
jgi:hypothetical protein